MLSTERFSCKGVNPFSSHMQDITRLAANKHCHQSVKKPVQKPASLLTAWIRNDLNHRARIFIIGVTRHFVVVVLDQVIATNTQPHGNGRRHEHG